MTLKALFVAGVVSLPVAAQAGTPAGKAYLTRPAAQVLEWVVRSRDNQGLPFIIIDKQQARVWVFDRAAKLKGNSPVLLGSARGDHSLPGIGEMKLSQIDPSDRTTPAGRFRADVGKNERGETVVWVDYDGGVSMHPVITTNPLERREQRLATPTPEDNRISFGCINVPKAFHQTVVLGTVKQSDSIVYVLPESLPLHTVFPQISQASQRHVAAR